MPTGSSESTQFREELSLPHAKRMPFQGAMGPFLSSHSPWKKTTSVIPWLLPAVCPQDTPEELMPDVE